MEIIGNSEQFVLEYKITKKCKLSCEYCCFRNIQEPSDVNTEVSDFVRLVDLISENINTDILFRVTGGEPILHPNFVEIVDAVRRKVTMVEICSSLHELSPAFSFDNVRVSATWHPSGTNFSRFLEHALCIRDNLDDIVVMYDNFSDYEAECNILKSIFGGAVLVMPCIAFVEDNMIVDKIPEDYMQDNWFFNKSMSINDEPTSAYDMIDKAYNKLNGCLCNCMYNKLVVNNAGDIFKCSSDLFYRKPPIVNISNVETITDLSIETVKCSNINCVFDVCETGDKYVTN